MAGEQLISTGEIEDEGEVSFSIHAEPIDSIREQWIGLHTIARAPGPFQRPEWHEAWLRHLSQGSDPVYLAVRRDDELIGIAVLDMDGGVAREAGDPNLRDYAGPLAAEGFENDIVLALLDWVAEDMTPSLQLWGMPRRNPLVALFQAEAADNGWTLSIEHEANCPVARLTGDWGSFVAGLSKHDRHELRRKLRHLESAGAVRYETTGDAAVIDRELDALFAMMRASHEGKAAFLSPAKEAFFRDLAATFAPLGLMRLGTLSLDGRPVAMLFTFEDEEGVYLYNSGFDPDYAPLAVGLLSKAYAIRDAIERGKSRFDFLRGDEDYKKRLGGTPEELVRLAFNRR